MESVERHMCVHVVEWRSGGWSGGRDHREVRWCA